MTYHPPPPNEPNGCLQTLVISRMIFQILAIPIAMILGTLTGIMVFLFVLSESPLLALLILVIIGVVIYAAIKWEKARVERQIPPDD